MFQRSIGETKTRVGVTVFSTDVKHPILLNSYYDKNYLAKAVQDIKYMGRKTNTARALGDMLSVQFNHSSGDRSHVKDVAIIITDGKSTDYENLPTRAKEVHDRHIEVYFMHI